MLLKQKKFDIFLPTILFLSIGIVPTVVCANFYTIIGPDGHPIIVQQSTEISKKKTAQKVESVGVNQSQNNMLDQKEQRNAQKKIDENNQKQKIEKDPISEDGIRKQKVQLIQDVRVDSLSINDHFSIQDSTLIDDTDHLRRQKINEIQLTPQQKSEAVKTSLNQTQVTVSKNMKKADKSELVSDQLADVPKAKTQVNNIQIDQAQSKNADQNFTVIDGVRYVNNEYLEDKEFNLEGKKRFYIMPAVSAGIPTRLETVEREKGVSHSFIDKIIKDKPDEKKSVALSATYYRLPKQDVIETLAQSCFTGKKLDKAKVLNIKNREIGFWPVAPIKEKFAFEVIQLDENIQDLLLTSYASSNKNPTYYWPLIVFLDQKGCVIEGVSGFKNQEIAESKFQHAALEGVLKKPSSSKYLFMTPLASAIDVENKQLINHGQIKLSVIR